MAIYLGLAGIILLLGCVWDVERSSSSRKSYLTVCFTLIFLVMALRSPSVGNDTRQFYEAYSILGKMEWSEYREQRYEWGFFALCKGLYCIFPHPQALLVVSSGVYCLSMAWFLGRYGENVVLETVLFLLLNLIAVAMNLMRQMLALSLILLAVGQMEQKHLGRGLLLLLCAPLFHRSAWFALIFPVLFTMKYPPALGIVLSSAAVVGFWRYENIFRIVTKILGSYTNYAVGVFSSSNYVGMMFRTLVCGAALLYGLFCRKGVSSEEERLPRDFLLYLLTGGLCCYILGMRMYIFARMAPYCTPFYLIWLGKAPPVRRWVSMPSPVGKTEIKCKAYSLETCLILFAALGYFLTIHLLRPQWQGIVPYRFFWQEG